ncbi:MAG: hypothetical protein ACRETC_08155 [Gammaproteobacteria bacterium]
MLPLAALLCVTAAQAASMDKSNVVRDYTDTVAPAEQQAYEAGIKNYNQCLSQHGFKFAWTAWSHVTGNTYMYSYDSDPATWADFDAMHTAGKACDSVWESDVNPHLMSETSAYMAAMPGMSYMPKGWRPGSGLVDVNYFTLKNGRAANEAFTNGIKKIYAAAAKTHWSGYSITSQVVGGGPGAPDYVLVIPAKNWADYGAAPNPSLWKMVANVYGKKKAAEIRKSINDAIKSSSEHMDRYNADLTYTPSNH